MSAEDEYTPDSDHERLPEKPQELQELTVSFKPFSVAAVVHLPGHPVGHCWIFDETWQGDKFMESASPLQRAMVRSILLQMVEDIDGRKETDG